MSFGARAMPRCARRGVSSGPDLAASAHDAAAAVRGKHSPTVGKARVVVARLQARAKLAWRPRRRAAAASADPTGVAFEAKMMIIGMTIRCIVRAVVAAVVVLGLAAAAGCSSGHDQVLASSESDEYSDLAWVGDSVYYFASVANDSGTQPRLMRVRSGGRPELVTIDVPDCRDERGVTPSPSAIVTISDHELGLIVHCEPPSISSEPSVFVRWDIDSGRTTTVAKIDYSGPGVAWSEGSGTA